MNLRMEIFPDEETGQWSYEVPALSSIGTGCSSKEKARKLGYEAIRFTLESSGAEQTPGAEVVMFNVEVTPVAQAG